MRDPQALGLELQIAQQEEVDVEGTGAVAWAGEHPAALGLDRFAGVEQGLRLQRGRDPHRGVQEVGLVEDLADGLGLVGRGDRVDLGAVLGQQPDRRPQVLEPVADVRAEPEVADARVGCQAGSSSAGSSSSSASRVTSTATSSIASGSGGSGFAARTTMVSQP